MSRHIAAILTGLAAFAAMAFVLTLVAKASWPAYAAAFPTRAYTLNMLLARLLAGGLAAFTAGTVAARVDRGSRQIARKTGAILLLISVVWHIMIWNQYPVWYHLAWFACIIPFSLCGGYIYTHSPHYFATAFNEK